jgi:3-hydroxyisobutyrate dehydrogenase/2-hydroxy-3-oxopropionate reductase
MSTVGPAAIERLAAALPAGTPLLDTPVLGSLSEAESGSLKIFVGGPRELFERWAPLLSELGEPMHAGPLGSGAAAKLVANLALLGTLTLVGEAVRLGDELGLEREKAFDVLAATPLAAQAERRRREAIESREPPPPRFALSLARKDGDLIAAAAPDLRVVEAARSWLRDAEAAGLGDRDYAAVLRYILSR